MQVSGPFGREDQTAKKSMRVPAYFDPAFDREVLIALRNSEDDLERIVYSVIDISAIGLCQSDIEAEPRVRVSMRG